MGARRWPAAWEVASQVEHGNVVDRAARAHEARCCAADGRGRRWWQGWLVRNRWSGGEGWVVGHLGSAVVGGGREVGRMQRKSRGQRGGEDTAGQARQAAQVELVRLRVCVVGV